MVHRNYRVLTCSAILAICLGCAPTQPQKFHMAFTPPSPKPEPAEPEFIEPPAVTLNLFLLNEVPTYITEQPRVPPKPTQSDALIPLAEQAFQRGKRLYQTGDKDRARKQFDRAIDIFFEASDNPTDRAGFERKFDETVDAIHRYDLAGMGPAAIAEPRFEKTPLDDILDLTFPVDPKLKSKVREEVQATVSQLPLTVNDSVLGFINFFSGRGRRTMIAGLQRAGRYRPLIQRILDEEGVPQELIHLAQAESGFLPRAVSPKAATGMWQFVKFRGQEYGLMQTGYSDDRLDPEKATRSAARHLRDLYNKFGDWYLAIAAYNCGPVNVERAVERTGYADFWELRNRRTLPLETTNYVPIIVAMTIMVKNAKEYGLEGIVPDSPLEYDVVEMTSPTHLALVGDLTETPVSELQGLNPALLKNIAPAGYSLNVPKGAASSLMAALQNVPAERRASWRMHKVENGETLATIGKRYGASPSMIAAANRLNAAGDPEIGDRIVIPKAIVEQSAALKATPKTALRKPAGSASSSRNRTRRPVAQSKSASKSPQTGKTLAKSASIAKNTRKRPSGT